MNAKAWRLYSAGDARLEDVELEGAGCGAMGLGCIDIARRLWKEESCFKDIHR